MFIGLQNNEVKFIAKTREELENLQFVELDRIEETDEEYYLHNGQYICGIPDMSTEERIDVLLKYLEETDWYVTRKAETGKEIPLDIVEKRQEARNEISELRGDV